MSNCTDTGFVGQYDISLLPLGADVTIPISYKPGGVAADLSAYTAKLQVRRTYSSPVLVELTSDDGSIVVSASEPNIILYFYKEKTQDLLITEGMIYDLEITDGANLVTRVLQGSFSVSKQVTV